MRRSAPSTIFSSASVKSGAALVVAAARGQQRRLVDEVAQVGADHARASSPRSRRGRRRRRAAPSGCGPRGSAGGRPGRAGATATRRSKRPGRSSAGSRISGRLVAASTITPSLPVKPSISVRIWLSVCSRSSWPPMLAPAAAGAADRVELVDEDDRRRGLLGLLEEVAHAAGADADDHLDELRRRHREERHVGLAGDGARQQRLAGARQARQQHALGDHPAEPPVALRVLEEVDDLDELLLGLVDAGDVGERRALARRRRSAWPSTAPGPSCRPRSRRRGASSARTARRAAASARSRAAASTGTSGSVSSGLALTTAFLASSSCEELIVGERRALGLEQVRDLALGARRVAQRPAEAALIVSPLEVTSATLPACACARK